MFSLPTDDTMNLFFSFSFHWFSDCHRNTIPVTSGTQAHNEGHYSILRFDTNMFRPENVHHILLAGERDFAFQALNLYT